MTINGREPYAGDDAKRKKRKGGDIPSAYAFLTFCIATIDGLPIDSALPYGVDETRVAAMTAALHSLAKSSVNEIGLGKFDQLYIKSSDGNLITLPAGPDAIFTVSTKEVRSLMLLDFKRISEEIAQLLGNRAK